MTYALRHSALALALSAAAFMTSPTWAQTDSGSAAKAVATQSADTKTNNPRADWIGLPAALQKLQAEGYTDIRKIQQTRTGYKAVAMDDQGNRTKLKIDPKSGTLTKIDTHKSHGDHAKKERHMKHKRSHDKHHSASDMSHKQPSQKSPAPANAATESPAKQ